MSGDDVLALTQALIAEQSITPQDANCQQIIRDFLTPLGFQIKDIPAEPVKNLWAMRGESAPLFVFAGHTDVVTPGDESLWDYPPFSATLTGEGLLYGRGSADMKAALAAQLVSVKNFIEKHPNFKGSIGFLITSAEEGEHYDLGTPKVLEYLHAQGIHIDYCLIGEPSCLHIIGDTLKVGRRGSLNAQLTIQGKQNHVAYGDWAENPIHSGAKAFADLSALAWPSGQTPFPDSKLQFTYLNSGQSQTNVTPGTLLARFNIRFASNITPEAIQADVEQILNKHSLDYKLEWRLSGPPFLAQDADFIQKIARSVEAVTQISPAQSTSGGTSDGRFIAKNGTEVVEFGLCNATIHQINEHIHLADLHVLVKIYQECLINILPND